MLHPGRAASKCLETGFSKESRNRAGGRNSGPVCPYKYCFPVLKKETRTIRVMFVFASEHIGGGYCSLCELSGVTCMVNS